jgi:hypothetical protein
MVALGIEFVREGQAVGGTEIDAEGAAFADVRPHENPALAGTLVAGGIAHAGLMVADLAKI